MWSRTSCSYLTKVLCLTVSLKESLSHRSMYSPTLWLPASKISPPSRSESALASFVATSWRVLP
jgi:hypothetical protein